MRTQIYAADWPTACRPAGRKIGILGGTFNPPHLGHLFLADEAARGFALDEVWLLPSGTPPHKVEDPVLDRDLRRQMASLLADERPFLRLCTLELDREGMTYTIDTLRQLARLLPAGTEVFYIIGSDTLFELVTWREFEAVFAMTQFLCIPRPGDAPEEIAARARQYEVEFGARILLGGRCAPDISSTMVRELFAAGQDVSALVPPSILEFMESNHVFGRK